jgi:hypothetical protein
MAKFKRFLPILKKGMMVVDDEKINGGAATLQNNAMEGCIFLE